MNYIPRTGLNHSFEAPMPELPPSPPAKYPSQEGTAKQSSAFNHEASKRAPLKEIHSVTKEVKKSGESAMENILVSKDKISEFRQAIEQKNKQIANLNQQLLDTKKKHRDLNNSIILRHEQQLHDINELKKAYQTFQKKLTMNEVYKTKFKELQRENELLKERLNNGITRQVAYTQTNTIIKMNQDIQTEGEYISIQTEENYLSQQEEHDISPQMHNLSICEDPMVLSPMVSRISPMKETDVIQDLASPHMPDNQSQNIICLDDDDEDVNIIDEQEELESIEQKSKSDSVASLFIPPENSKVQSQQPFRFIQPLPLFSQLQSQAIESSNAEQDSNHSSRSLRKKKKKNLAEPSVRSKLRRGDKITFGIEKSNVQMIFKKAPIDSKSRNKENVKPDS